MPERTFAAVEMAAPVMAHCTICSWEDCCNVSASAAPVTAPATALFFCIKKNKFMIMFNHPFGELQKQKQ